MSQVALAPGCAREYETVYILRPNTDRDAASNVIGRVAEAVRGHGGQMTEVELWGRRRLAYPIDRHHRGVYVYLKYLGKGDTVAELERQLRLADPVIRWQTIQLRNNVPVASIEPKNESELEVDYDLTEEPDEPEVTRERELGLDAPPPDRRRRDERRDRDRDRDARSDDDDDGDDSPLSGGDGGFNESPNLGAGGDDKED